MENREMWFWLGGEKRRGIYSFFTRTLVGRLYGIGEGSSCSSTGLCIATTTTKYYYYHI